MKFELEFSVVDTADPRLARHRCVVENKNDKTWKVIEGSPFERTDAPARRAALGGLFDGLKHTLKLATFPRDTMRYEAVTTNTGVKYIPKGYPE